MEYPQPASKDFTIYTISKCGYCNRFKNVLAKHSLPAATIINCDLFVENATAKQDFFRFINEFSSPKKHQTFPVIFHNGEYIGGYMDACAYVEGMLEF